MPIYEYSCPQCAQVFEEWQKDFEDREMKCPQCGAASKRLISNTAFILKGSGWYVTDYANGKKNGEQPAADSSETPSSGDTASAKNNGDQAKNNGGQKTGKQEAAPASTPKKSETSAKENKSTSRT